MFSAMQYSYVPRIANTIMLKTDPGGTPLSFVSTILLIFGTGGETN